MKYMGSKNRYAKLILPIILKDRYPDQWYVEPFVGGCNMIDKVDGKRMGNDKHPYLISMWKAVQNGWLPPRNITEEMYNNIKNNIDNYPSALVGYAGFSLSYGALWFSSYRKDNIGKRNYSCESHRSLLKQIPYVKDIVFSNLNYWEIEIPSKSIIYCDPPYENTTSYKGTNPFDHVKFWQWCREKTAEGHQVFISEYHAPEDFECVWQKIVNSSLGKNTGSKKETEKLFKLREKL